MRGKLLVFYLFVVFLPVLAIGLILSGKLYAVEASRTSAEIEESSERVCKRLEYTLKIPIDISNKLYYEENLQKILNTQYTKTADIIRDYNKYSEFSDFRRLYSEISYIRLYSFNKSLLNNWEFIPVTQDIEKLEWFKSALNKKGRILWRYITNEVVIKQRNRKQLCLIRFVKSQMGQPLGVLVIDVNMDNLSAFLEQEKFDILLCDDSANIISAKNKSFEGRKLEQVLGNAKFHKGSQYSEKVTFKNRVCKITFNVLSSTQYDEKFSVICIYPLKYITSSARKIRNTSLLITFSSLFLSVVIIILFSHIISRRIKKLTMDMQTVASGKLDHISKISGNDEIGSLSSNLNRMVKNLNDLSRDNLRVNLQNKQLVINQKEMELKMLISKINPHFLFNTLESVRMKALCTGNTEIAEIVMLLGRIIRQNLKLGNEQIYLIDEINTVRAYLEIQRFRFGDRIAYTVECPYNLEKRKILPLLIQPIVENALVHGLENSSVPGLVSVSVIETGDFLRISVADNGSGMKEDELDRLVESLKEIDNKAESHIGLVNVYQRIKVFYGEEYGIKVESSPGKGTRVDILLPKE